MSGNSLLLTARELRSRLFNKKQIIFAIYSSRYREVITFESANNGVVLDYGGGEDDIEQMYMETSV